jgi:hypothetical protein
LDVSAPVAAQTLDTAPGRSWKARQSSSDRRSHRVGGFGIVDESAAHTASSGDQVGRPCGDRVDGRRRRRCPIVVVGSNLQLRSGKQRFRHVAAQRRATGARHLGSSSRGFTVSKTGRLRGRRSLRTGSDCSRYLATVLRLYPVRALRAGYFGPRSVPYVAAALRTAGFLGANSNAGQRSDG